MRLTDSARVEDCSVFLDGALEGEVRVYINVPSGFRVVHELQSTNQVIVKLERVYLPALV